MSVCASFVVGTAFQLESVVDSAAHVEANRADAAGSRVFVYLISIAAANTSPAPVVSNPALGILLAYEGIGVTFEPLSRYRVEPCAPLVTTKISAMLSHSPRVSSWTSSSDRTQML